MGAGLGAVVDAHADQGLAHGCVGAHVRRRVKHLEDAALDPPAVPLSVYALCPLLRQHLCGELVDVRLLEEGAPTDGRGVLHAQREMEVLHDLLLD